MSSIYSEEGISYSDSASGGDVAVMYASTMRSSQLPRTDKDANGYSSSEMSAARGAGNLRSPLSVLDVVSPFESPASASGKSECRFHPMSTHLLPAIHSGPMVHRAPPCMSMVLASGGKRVLPSTHLFKDALETTHQPACVKDGFDRFEVTSLSDNQSSQSLLWATPIPIDGNTCNYLHHEHVPLSDKSSIDYSSSINNNNSNAAECRASDDEGNISAQNNLMDVNDAHEQMNDTSGGIGESAWWWELDVRGYVLDGIKIAATVAKMGGDIDVDPEDEEEGGRSEEEVGGDGGEAMEVDWETAAAVDWLCSLRR